jgi:hypothetical protein
MYINNLKDSNDILGFHLFADDSSLFYTDKSLSGSSYSKESWP